MLARLMIFIPMILLLFACQKDEFAIKKSGQTGSSSPIMHNSQSRCANYTLVKPPVDFLFLWDNSSSQLFINPTTKAALNNVINLISSQFDYHLVLAPLVEVSGTTSPTYLVTDSPNGLSGNASSMIVPKDQAANLLDTFPGAVGSYEEGIDRAYHLIDSNRSNGIFRSGGYTIVVVMSNGDDSSFPGASNFTPPPQNFLPYKLQLYDNLKTTLNGQMFRFMSMVAHSACGAGYKQNDLYKNFSQMIYANHTVNPPTDQFGRATPDSWDICGMDFTHLFDGINNAIQAQVVNHIYDHWPITTNLGEIDFDQIIVSKNTGQVLQKDDAVNGFTVEGYLTNQNTRVLPTPGEPFSGQMIKLYGAGKVTYPECLNITTQTPADFYGYIPLSTKPLVTTINLEVNGVTIPKYDPPQTTFGWEYIGHSNSQNILVISPTNPSPDYPALNKTGYFLKLHGSAIYSNNSNYQVNYDPASN